MQDRLKARPIRPLGLLFFLACWGGAMGQVQQAPLVSQEFRYWILDGQKVFLVWGINGWSLAPEQLRRAGTTVQEGRLFTPMTKTDGAFAAQLSLPRGTAIDFAFLTTEAGDGRQVESWDGKPPGGFHTVASQKNVIAFSSWHRAAEVRNASGGRNWPLLLLGAGGMLAGLVLTHRFGLFRPPRRPSTPETRVLAILASLGIVLIAIRAAVLRPANAPLESMLAEAPKVLAASCYDFLFTALLAVPFLGLARLARRRKRLEATVVACCAAAALGFLVVHAANIYVVRAMHRPFYYQWLYYSGFLQSLDARVALAANLSWRFGVQVATLAVFMALLSRLAAHVFAGGRRLGAACAIAALAYVSFSAWYINTRKLDYPLIANPVLYFGQSFLARDARMPLYSVPVSEASLAEFQNAPVRRAVPEKRTRPYNVLLLVLESVPAGMLKAYGGRYPATPELDRRLPQAVTFTNIYAHSPSTTRAMVSLLGAVHPWISDRMVTYEYPAIEIPTLSSELHRAAYRTAFMSSADNSYLGTGRFLSHRRFDTVLDRNTIRCEGAEFRDGTGKAGVDDDCLADAFLDWQAEGQGQPFFCVLWTFQTHYPYFFAEAPAEYEPGNASLNRYLNALHHTDAVLGRVLNALESRNLLDRTLVVVTGDHGEDFRRDVTGHGWSLYEEEVHVPLILINGTLFGGERNATVGGQMDIGPTILSLLHLPAPAGWQGRPLVEGDAGRRVYLFDPLPDFQFGYREGDLKLLFNASSGEYEAYDLSKDPFETHNLVPEKPDLRREAEQRLARWVQYQDRYMRKLLSPVNRPSE